MTDLIDATTLTPAEHALVDEIAARRDEIVALACDADPLRHAEPRPSRRRRRGEEAALQAGAGRAAARRRAPTVDLWEPTPDEVDGPPADARGGHRLRRPPAARGALRRLGRRRVAAAERAHRRRHRPPRGRLGRTTRSTPQVRDGRIVRPRRVRHEGRDRGDGRRRRGAGRAPGGLRGDLIVCTNTDEECGGVGALACARHGVARRLRDRRRSRPASRCGPPAAAASTATVDVPRPRRARRAGARALPRRRRRERDREGAHLLDGVDRLRADWRSRLASRHPLLPPPDVALHAPRRRLGLDRDDPEPRRR